MATVGRTRGRAGSAAVMGTHPARVLRGSIKAHDSLVAACRALLMLHGVPCFRINQRPVMKRSGQWSSPGADRGAPDLMASYKGRALLLECKTGNATVSMKQHEEHTRWAKSGALVLVVRSILDLDPLFTDWH